jgi:hypothetical protein
MVQSISFDPILSGDLVGLGGFEDSNHQDPRRDLTSFSVATPVLDYIVPAGISLRVILSYVYRIRTPRLVGLTMR